MYVVPKTMFPFMWKKNNPPKTLHLKRKGEGVYGDLFQCHQFKKKYCNELQYFFNIYDKIKQKGRKYDKIWLQRIK